MSANRDRKPKMNFVEKKSPLLIVAITATVALAGTVWTWGQPSAEKMITIRYVLFGLSALAAFITPYMLFPDRYRPVIQLANPKGAIVGKHLIQKMQLLLISGSVLLVFMAIGGIMSDSGSITEILLTAAGSVLFYSAILNLARYRYLQSGPDSQFWRESEKGREYRKKMADYFKYPLDPGSIPSLINTVVIFLSGSVIIIVGTVLYETIAGWSETLLYCIFWVIIYFMIRRQEMSVVRYYYSTNAFFSEFFRESQDGDAQESVKTADQLWWVPARLRPHVWQLTLQTDRIVPAGRTIFAAHVAMLFVAYQKPDGDFLFMLWMGFALLHHLFIPLSARDDVAPGWLIQWIAGETTMVLSRVWMQVRWVLPLLIGMNVQHFIFGVLEFRLQLLLILFYLLSAFIVAGLHYAIGSNLKMTSS